MQGLGMQWDGRPHPQRPLCAKVEVLLQPLKPRGTSTVKITAIGLDLATQYSHANQSKMSAAAEHHLRTLRTSRESNDLFQNLQAKHAV
jgi:hypothetical protein